METASRDPWLKLWGCSCESPSQERLPNVRYGRKNSLKRLFVRFMDTKEFLRRDDRSVRQALPKPPGCVIATAVQRQEIIIDADQMSRLTCNRQFNQG